MDDRVAIKLEGFFYTLLYQLITVIGIRGGQQKSPFAMPISYLKRWVVQRINSLFFKQSCYVNSSNQQYKRDLYESDFDYHTFYFRFNRL